MKQSNNNRQTKKRIRKQELYIYAYRHVWNALQKSDGYGRASLGKTGQLAMWILFQFPFFHARISWFVRTRKWGQDNPWSDNTPIACTGLWRRPERILVSWSILFQTPSTKNYGSPNWKSWPSIFVEIPEFLCRSTRLVPGKARWDWVDWSEPPCVNDALRSEND